MMIQKTCSTLVIYLFTCMFAVLVAGCTSGSGDQTGTEPVNPLAANYNELTAIPGPMVAVRVGGVATLDGSDSAITSTKPLSYSWSFSYKPDASTAILQGATTATPSFIADVRGVYMVQLLVSADGVSSQRAIAIVIATNESESLIGPFPGHQGMSSNCGGCHNGVNKVGNGNFIPPKVPNHIATSNQCQGCHTPQGFAIIPFVDHQEIFGKCSECHNNIVAIGKSEFHQPTAAECDDCHNTIHFLELNPDGSFDHSNITRACSGCHNGTVAIGKTQTPTDTPPGNHPNTGSECGYCHTTASFLNAYPDHTGPAVVGNRCDSCHGVSQNDQPRDPPAGHPVTNVDCASCHSIVSFKMPGGIFNHSLLDATVQRCDSCHNASTSINAKAATDTATHRDTAEDCGSCHNTESFADAIFDHTGIVNDCGLSCHVADGSGTATGMPLGTPFYAHMPTTEDCSICHTPGTFTTGTFNHSGPSFVGRCDSCHDNRIGVGKLPNHIPTDLNDDCGVCHVTTDFADVTFDHNTTNTSDCTLCHDGNISKGKPFGHITTDLNCATCHLVDSSFSTFAGTFVHDLSIVGGNCASCHNSGIATPKKVNHIPAQAECSECHSDMSTGGFASSTFMANIHPGISNGCEGCHSSIFIPNNPNAVKTASHLPTDQDCDVCHTNTTFSSSIFSHAGITGNCASCHDGSVNNIAAGALGMTPDHPVTNGQDCGICHGIGANFKDGVFDHSGRVDNCAECHGDNATGASTKKNTGHVVTTEDCSVCHVPGTFATAVFNHTGIVDNCASCHDGSAAIATVKSGSHLPTTKDCSVCHNTVAFAGATFDHQGIVDNCASCHDGATARGKIPPPDHVPTNGDCGECHVTTGFIPGTFSHTGIVDDCRSCHNGAFAAGKTDTHVQTNQDCGVCHNTSMPLTFAGAIFDHTGIVDNCVSCHDGGTAIGMDAKTNPAHLATALDCHFCHTTATFVGGTWTHDSSSAGHCDQCHVNGGGATLKPNDHLSTTVQCDICHTTNGWAPTDFSHDPNGDYPGNHRRDPGCNGCHGSSVDSAFPWPAAQYAPYCAACHSRDFESVDKHIGGKNGTVEQNKDCSGGGSGCHSITSSEF